ncbi:hypothetical protein ACC807_23370 [Rhizobium ruizarguesonis]
MPHDVVTASLNARDKSGRIDVRFGAGMKTVGVSRRALLSIASPPRATEVRLLQHIDAFCEIVASGLGSKSSGGDVVLVTANDVPRWAPRVAIVRSGGGDINRTARCRVIEARRDLSDSLFAL